MRLIGKIKDAHGLKGELYVLVFSGDVSWLDDLKTFGIGELPPHGREPRADVKVDVFTCEKARPFKDGLIVKPVEVKDRTAAEAVRGRGFYLPDETFVSAPGETIYLDEILGFSLRDPSGRDLGEIIGFSSNGLQDLLVVRTAKGEAEVPFVDDFIEEIEFDERVVVMNLPEGLLDLSAVEE